MSFITKALAISLKSAILASAILTPAAAMAWTKTYVVEYFEPAMLYGGPANGGGDTPGTDCPKGVNEMDWKKLLTTSYRTPDQSNAINNAEYGRGKFLAHLGFRGTNRENIYEKPTSIPDPGMIEVSSKVAEGFDLDDNPNTGFVGPNGEKGIDNAFYKAGGCVLYFRAPPRGAAGFKNINDEMHDGSFTVVFVFTGAGKDAMNDDDVTVGVYASKDKSVKDANGQIALDYSFNITPDPNYGSIFKARIANGVLETKAPITYVTHDLVRTRDAPLVLEKAKVRFTFKEDGTVEGLVGGYRDFFTHYRLIFGDGRTIQGGIRENLGHFSASAWYYALRRAADGLPDPVTGANRGISTVYRYRMVPAMVLAPDGKMALSALQAGVVAAAPMRDVDNSEGARLATASFEPIDAVAKTGKTIRRVSYRDPFATPTMPNITLEKTAAGDYTYLVTANSGKISYSGKIKPEEWNAVVALDPVLAPRKAGVIKAKAEVCHSKRMVIEAVQNGKAVRREASVCGGAPDTPSVLYGYKVAEVVMNNLPKCRGFIESGRESSWQLTECLRPTVRGSADAGGYEAQLANN